jgi:hypothetical protein
MKTLEAVTIIAILGMATPALAQRKVFDWLPANDESVQLDPAEVHTGRVYRPGPDGGNMHVDIEAQQPVTIEMARAEEWNAALQHPETIGNVEFLCVREHVVKSTYVCNLPPSTPMTLALRDERNADRAVFAGLGSILSGHNGVRQLASANNLHIQYYRWACIADCNPPEFQWFQQVKEKYELTPVMKVYGGYVPVSDGEQVSIKIKSPVPMAVAMVPPQVADQLGAKPDTLGTTLAGNACKQRGIQKLTFQCTFSGGDGPQSLVVMPEPGVEVPNHKKAEIEFYAYKCVANCSAPGPK